MQIINSIFNSQRIIIESDKLHLHKIQPILGKKYTWDIKQIKSVGYQQTKSGDSESNRVDVSVEPAVFNWSDTIAFFEFASNVEQEWIIAYFSDKITKK